MKINYRAYIPSAVSGAALIFCFPYFDLYPLAWVALVPFLVSLCGMTAGRAFKAGFVMGLFYFFGTVHWVYHSINHYGGVSFVPSLLVALLLAMYLSLYTAVFGALFSYRTKDSTIPAALVAPFFWVVLEYVRSFALTGFPWSIVGYSQYKFLPVIQIADITGVYGVSFLVVAVNGALADFFIAGRRRREKPLSQMSPTYVAHALLLVLLAASLIYGSYRLGEDRPGRPLKVSVVQGNISQNLKWDEKYKSDTLDIYRLNTMFARREAPSLIVWPETAAPFYFGYDKPYTEMMLRFQKALGTHLLFGAITVKGDRRLANSAILFTPNGETAYVYDKIHLVPFGEYVPLRKLLFFIDKITVGIGDYVAGDDHIRAKTPFGEFGTHICYEIIFPDEVRQSYRDGGDFIVTITNDAWFGRTPGPYQHFSFGVLRAVENRKPVVRAANTGISGFMDSNGRVLGKTGLFEAKVLTEEIKTDGTRTVYTRYGDLFVYFCIVITTMILMYSRRK
jgi:apolipoprotein N-acyltransferase